MTTYVEPSKDDFVLADHSVKVEADGFQTKPIGYYKDAFNRFRKNKVSLFAFIILALLLIMSIFGPLLNNYSSDTINTKVGELPPRIPGVEKIGIFKGYKTLHTFSTTKLEDMLIADLYVQDLIISVTPKEEGGFTNYYYKLDYYKYVDYKYTYGPQAFMTVTETEMLKMEELGVLLFSEEVEGMYSVRVKYYEYLGYADGAAPYYWFGTTPSGQDMFTLLWESARISLLVAFSVSIINIIVGVLIGAVSGYYGGIVDLIIERVSEVLSGLPFLAILTLLLLRFGSNFGIVIVAFTLTGWLGIASLTRTQFYRYKNREYVLASRTLGASDLRIMSRHIFPNAAGTIITSLVLYVPSMIFTESTYSFLGIIQYGSASSIGKLLSDGQSTMDANPHLLWAPALFIAFLMISFNLFGNGLRDAFNPSLRGVDE